MYFKIKLSFNIFIEFRKKFEKNFNFSGIIRAEIMTKIIEDPQVLREDIGVIMIGEIMIEEREIETETVIEKEEDLEKNLESGLEIDHALEREMTNTKEGIN